VHLQFRDSRSTTSSDLNDLIALRDRNAIIFAGRRFGITRDTPDYYYEIERPTQEFFEHLLQKRWGVTPSDGFQHWEKLRLAEILGQFQTPHDLILFSEAYDSFNDVPSQSSELFHAVRYSRAGRESATKPVFEEDILITDLTLGGLALAMFESSDPFRATELDVHRFLKTVTDELDEEYGFQKEAPGSSLAKFASAGYLFLENGFVRFEHDRWQEYFGAVYIARRELRLGKLHIDFSIDEIARIITELGSASLVNPHQRFWSKFWIDISEKWPHLGLSLLNKPDSATIESEQINSLHDSVQQNYRSEYGELLQNFQRLSELHFPALLKVYDDYRSSDIGLAVMNEIGEKPNSKNAFLGRWFGFTVHPENAGNVIVKDYTSLDDPPIILRHDLKALGIQSWPVDQATSDVPEKGALRIAFSLLERRVNQWTLKEPTSLVVEDAFHSWHALYKRVGQKVPEEVTVKQIMNLLIQIRSKIGAFEWDVREADDVRGYNRKVTFHSLTFTASKLDQDLKLEPRDYDFIAEPTFSDDVSKERFLNNISAFHRDVHHSLSNILDLNMPSIKGRILTHLGYPQKIVYTFGTKDSSGPVDSSTNILSRMYTFRGTESQTYPVVVELMSENEIQRLLKDKTSRGATVSFPRLPKLVDPLRREVYSNMEEAWEYLKG